VTTVTLPARRIEPQAARDGRMGPRARRIRVWVGAGILLWAVLATAEVGRAYAAGTDGKHHLNQARRTLDGSGAAAPSQGLTHALERARRAFDRSQQRSSSPLLLPLEVVPVVGRQLRSYSALAGAASRVAEITLATTEGAQRALDRPAPAGEARLSLLANLSRLAHRSEAELARVHVHSSTGLVAPLARQWAELDSQLRQAGKRLHDGAQVLDALTAALAGPRRYLLLIANNAEMRAGSGMFLGVGAIEATGGALHLRPIHPAGELRLQDSGPALDGDLGDRWGWLQPGREWRNLGTTPRFDATASLAARMWERLTGEHVDGALAVDVVFLRGLLAATGPLVVGPDTVSATNVVEYVLRDQYAGMTIDTAQNARRDRLGDIAAAVFAAIESGSPALRTLAQEGVRTARGRHLLAWSVHPVEQRGWAAAGIDGVLAPESLAVNFLNRGGNKLDQFLTVDAAIDLRPSGGTTEILLRLDVTNQTPPGEPPYVAGPHPQSGVGEGDYLGIVTVNLPAAATDIRFDHGPPLVASGRDGPTQVVAAPLLVHRGEHRTIYLGFRLPGDGGALTVHPSARLPPIRWQQGASRWVDDSARSVRW